MGFVSKIFSGPSVTVQKQEAPATATATAAAPVSDNTAKQDTAVDTNGDTLKRKAKGKKGLMINGGANSTGGGTSGGTGLNI